MNAKDLREITIAAWKSDCEQPDAAVMSRLHRAATRGYAWTIIGESDVTPKQLRWLSLNGYQLQKLLPKVDQPAISWRVSWVRLPGIDSDLRHE